MTTNKKTHTIEEIDELKTWFDTNKNLIPKEMQINPSAYTPNLEGTITMLFEQAYINHGNPKMQGSIWLLQTIKQNIENNGYDTSARFS